ncbi:MAG: hypothetical protein WC889_05995, partial [Myxococcota bacterium]
MAWASSHPEVASVAQTGLLTGGEKEGVTEISAAVNGMICGRVIVRNRTPQKDVVTVYVVDEIGGAPVQGAFVKVGEEGFKTTDAEGTALFGQPGDVHVMHDDFAWLSVFGVRQEVYVVSLSRKPQAGRAAGYNGSFDFDGTQTKLRSGLASFSISGQDALDGDFSSISGDIFATPINISSPGTVKQCLPAPSTLMGGCYYIKAPDLISAYNVKTAPVIGSAWGMEFGFSMGDITDWLKAISPFLGSRIDGGDDPLSSSVQRAAMNFLHNGSHLLAPVLLPKELEKIDVPIITCPDGKKTPQIESEDGKMADYDRFNRVDLKNKVAMRLSTVVDVGE